MTSLTTMKISPATRDELKAIAERDGLSLEAALRKLLKGERQRRMGEELMAAPPTDEERSIIAGSTQAVARALG
jgi:hypothetical protein